MRLLSLFAVLALALAAGPAAAHPHVFVDASHELIFDGEGRLTAVRARWDYDELFTLLMVEDGGYDNDDDGEISPGELADMRLWDANWPADFFGDLEIEVGGGTVALEGPSDWAAEWHDGRAVSIHTRRLSVPADVSSGIILRAYDPYYYVAYAIAGPPNFTGRDDCRSVHITPNTDAVSPEIAAAVAALPAGETPAQAGLPAIGRLWAEESHITCGG